MSYDNRIDYFAVLMDRLYELGFAMKTYQSTLSDASKRMFCGNDGTFSVTDPNTLTALAGLPGWRDTLKENELEMFEFLMASRDAFCAVHGVDASDQLLYLVPNE